MPVISDAPLKLFTSAEETAEKPEQAAVIGTLPSWIQGNFLRIGPGKFDFGHEFQMHHWLDGYALLQRFEITKDFVKFEKKYLQSDAYKRGLAAGRPVIAEFATGAQRDPNKGFFSRMVSNLLPEFTDNNYSTLFHISSDIFATCDTCFFRKVNGKTLDSYEKYDGNKLFGLNGQSAHPLCDTATGDMYNSGFALFPSSKYSIIKMKKAKSSKEMLKSVTVLATIPSRWVGALSINHSFGLTPNYCCYIEQPYIVSVSKIASSLIKGQTLKDILEWRPQEKNRFIIVEKSSGKVIKTEFLSAESFYFMHIVNCYEDNNQIVVDLISYESPNMLDSLYLNKLRDCETDVNVDLSCIQRFVIPIISDLKLIDEGVELVQTKTRCSAIRRGNKIILEGCNITERGIEMPTINKRFQGIKYRYIYAAGTFNQSCYSHTITKTDLQSGETTVWKEGDYLYPGEPYFVPNPNNENEDDGILISGVTDSRENHEDYLLFLDAKTMTEIGRATFKIENVPSALHGLFLPN